MSTSVLPNRQLSLVILLFAALAAALSLYLPRWLPGTGVEAAILVGVLAFLVLLLLQLLWIRRLAMASLVGEVTALRHERDGLQSEIAGMRRELTSLLRSLQAEGVVPSGAFSVEDLGKGDILVEDLQTLAGEARLLQGLSAQIEAARANRSAAPEGRRAIIEALDEEEVLDILQSAVTEGRVDVTLQPIVALPQRKRAFYLCSARIQAAPGESLEPTHYLPVAEREGLTPAIDNLLLFRCVQLVRKSQRCNLDARAFFCRISPNSLADEAFFGEFLEFLAGEEKLDKALVFEFSYDDFDHLTPAARDHLEQLSRLGFRFCVDGVLDLNLDAGELYQRSVRFVKVPARRFSYLLDGDGLATAQRFKLDLERNHIDLIVEEIGDEETLVELLDLKVDYGQGNLFGGPRLARPA